MAANDFTADEKAALRAQHALPLTTPAADLKGTEPVTPAAPGTTIEKLLTPTRDEPGEPYVYFKQVRVERALVDDWKAGQTYLSKVPQAIDSLSALENGTAVVTVHKIGNGDDLFDSNSSTIDWDPHAGLINADGSKQTPALGLLHEQGHATEYARNPTRMDANSGLANQRYDYAEEQRNETANETPAAKLLREGTREDHGGTNFNVKGPASIETTDTAITNPGDLRKAIHNERFGLAMHGYTVPPPPGVSAASIEAWDGKTHKGSMIHINGNTVAQYVGGSKYEVYDVAKDLHGVMPPENNPNVAIDAKGVVTYPGQAMPTALEAGVAAAGQVGAAAAAQAAAAAAAHSVGGR